MPNEIEPLPPPWILRPILAFGNYFKQQNKLYWFLMLLLILRAAAPWMVDRANFPDEPESVRPLYRQMPDSGEITYYPEIRSLSEGNLHERFVRENLGKGMRAFPLASILPSALLFAFLQGHSFWVADMLCIASYYIVLVFFLQTFKINSPWPQALAAGIAMGVYRPFVGLFYSQFPLYVNFWHWRMPNPFISGLYLLGCLLVMRLICLRNGSLTCLATLLGVLNGLLLQGDLHSAFVIFPASLVLLPRGICKGECWPSIKASLYFGIAFLLSISIFLLQRSYAHPDIASRMGLMGWSLSEMPPFWEFYNAPARNIFSCALITSVAICLVPRWKERCEVAWFFPLVLILAWFAPYYSVAATHQAIQIVHFDFRTLPIISSYVLLISTVTIFADFPGVTFRHRRIVSMSGACLLVFLTVLIGVVQVVKMKTLKYNDSAYGAGYSKPNSNYRQDFLNVIKLLQTQPENSVLHSMDMQLLIWWMTYQRNGYVFMPSPFSSALSDAELERRYFVSLRLIGVTDAEFPARIEMAAPLLYHEKYEANRYLKWGADDEYEPADLQRIKQTSHLTLFKYALPRQKAAQLLKDYVKMKQPPVDLPPPDIVVSKWEFDQPLQSFIPYRCIYSNPNFSVWVLMKNRNP